MAFGDRMVVEIEDLCTALGVGKNTAYSLLINGEIDAFKIGTVWKIPVSSIDAYVNKKCEDFKEEKETKQLCKITNQ